jgi:gag-polypeptide of LTR copia-type
MNSVPDEVFNHIKGGVSVKDWWDSLKTICKGWSRSLLINLGCKLQNTYCGDDDNVHAHFAKLVNIHEQLMAMGQSVADQQYANILLALLPPCYKMRICAITMNADETACDIDPTRIVKLISDDYDKRMLTRCKDNNKNQAFITSGQKKDCCEIKCFNCKKKGHIKANCWAKGDRKEGQRPNHQKPQVKGSNIVATVADKKEQDLESWAAILAEESKESCDADDEDQSWATIEEISDEDQSVSIEEMPEEMANTINSLTSHKVKLYDSGASQHISPFRDQFLLYCEIPLHPITAADKCTFYAIGSSDMRIEVPNGGMTLQVLM